MERFKKIWAVIWRRRSLLTFGHVVVGVTFVVVVAGVVTIFAITPLPGEVAVKDFKEYSEIIRNYFFAGAGLGAATIGLFLAWQRTQAATKQADISQESHYTELFTKAIEQLGNKDLSIRLGGIYALERIAKESKKDHWPIMEVLTAFIRTNAKKVEDPENEAILDENVKPAEDIQAILTVLSRRNVDHETKDNHLDLQDVNISGARMEYSIFRYANFSGSKLDLVVMVGSNLKSAIFSEAKLRRANFFEANLRYAFFTNADLRLSSLIGANLEHTKLVNALLFGANLSHVKNFTKKQKGELDFDNYTTFPDHIAEDDFKPPDA